MRNSPSLKVTPNTTSLGFCVWCARSTENTSLLLNAIHLGSTNINSTANTIFTCKACEHTRAQTPPALWLLQAVDCGQSVSWTTVEQGLRTLHRQHKSLRPRIALELDALALARLPGESANSGRKRRLLARDGGGCVWCSKPLPARECTIEHLLPSAHGGHNRLTNLMCACFACNNARGTTTVSQWLRVCERNGLTPHRNAIINALTRLAAEHGPAAALAASELADLTSARTWQQRHHQRGHTRKRVRVRTRTRQQSSDTAYELAYALYPSS